MTGRPPYKPCKVPGCNKDINEGCQYCAGHAEIAEIRVDPGVDANGLLQDDPGRLGISQLPLI